MNTENNHESMKTVVETFLTEETVELIYSNEELEKWNKHVEELSLVGQTKIVKKGCSPIPFMHLKTSYKNICEELCPRKVDVKKYDATPIPVKILDLVALSKKEGYFKEIEIWYDERSPDPFCIGISRKWTNAMRSGYVFNSAEEACAGTDQTPKDLAYYYQDTYYLLGKWADVKHTWAELRDMAIERFKSSKVNECNKAILEAKRSLEDLDIQAFDKFN